MTEKRAFKMHPQLLYSVIQRQAGTLSKAVLEGVMNAIDADATRIDITMACDCVGIVDNGKGFRNRKEIEEWFEVFGQPHAETEHKVYGAFRMGRGQLFAFGVNAWSTGVFRMAVDIKGKGLEYDLTDHAEPVTGCAVSVQLYQHLLPSGLAASARDLEQMVKWASVPIYLNDKLISQDPADAKWDEESDDAYIKFTAAGGLKVYNLGVFVHEVPGYHLGTGGTVVSKRQLKVNFARNDVQADCPVWKRVKKRVDQRATEENIKKPALDDDERQRIVDQVLCGELAWDKVSRLKLFMDVTGRNRSVGELKAPRWPAVTVARLGDRVGDKLMQSELAFVLADETLVRFDVESVEALSKLLLKWGAIYSKLTVKSFTELAKAFKTDHRVLDAKKLTRHETALLSTIEYVQHCLLTYGHKGYEGQRKIVLGDSDTADAWTDGSGYIAISRRFLHNVGTGADGWVRIGQLLVHEYAHNDPDSDTHIHSPAFYQDYHDHSHRVGRFVESALGRYALALTTQNLRAKKDMLKAQDQLANTKQRESALAASVPQKEV